MCWSLQVAIPNYRNPYVWAEGYCQKSATVSCNCFDHFPLMDHEFPLRPGRLTSHDFLGTLSEICEKIRQVGTVGTGTLLWSWLRKTQANTMASICWCIGVNNLYDTKPNNVICYYKGTPSKFVTYICILYHPRIKKTSNGPMAPHNIPATVSRDEVG